MTENPIRSWSVARSGASMTIKGHRVVEHPESGFMREPVKLTNVVLIEPTDVSRQTATCRDGSKHLLANV